MIIIEAYVIKGVFIMENKYLEINNALIKILEHRSSQKVKNRQAISYIQEFIHLANMNNEHSFENCLQIKDSLIELYKSFYTSYPNIDIIAQHALLLEDLRKQFTNEEETILFLETAILQVYAITHNQSCIDQWKQHLFTIYSSHPLQIYHAIFSGLKVKPEISLLKMYYEEMKDIEPSNLEETKHLESIHEIYEKLIWKKKQ